VYFYASELAVFNFANSPYSERHAIVEYIVVLNPKHFYWTPLMRLLSLTPDYDFIMVNQIMATFKFQPGYLMNNVSGETWSWKKPLFITNDPTIKTIILFARKGAQIVGFVVAFGMISAVNGVVIRFALVCSNIVLVPIMALLTWLGVNNDERSRAVIYQSMGLVGAQMAHYDS
jgi:hypothetical protein